MSNVSNVTTTAAPIPAWVEPPLDAWEHHPGKLMILFIYYIVCFFIGQFVNWLCLLNINKTKLTQSARFMMLTQCTMNTWYISINFPYKAAILYVQHTFLPHGLKMFCGFLHLFVVFGSMFLQDVMAVTRVIYIVFPTKAKTWFNTFGKSMIPAIIPVVFGILYGAPSLHPCCYRFYKFTSYAMSYVGYHNQIQLKFSITGSCVLVFTLITCYTWVFFTIRNAGKRMSKGDDDKRDKKEIRLTVLFAITGGVWFVYLAMFYTIYWSGLFKAYSALLLMNEMLEQFLFFVDPIVYIGMSSELRRPLYKLIGRADLVHPTTVGGQTTNAPTKVTKVEPQQNDKKDMVVVEA